MYLILRESYVHLIPDVRKLKPKYTKKKPLNEWSRKIFWTMNRKAVEFRTKIATTIIDQMWYTGDSNFCYLLFYQKSLDVQIPKKKILIVNRQFILEPQLLLMVCKWHWHIMTWRSRNSWRKLVPKDVNKNHDSGTVHVMVYISKIVVRYYLSVSSWNFMRQRFY